MMVDLILLAFFIAVFCAGFWAGAKFGTVAKAWAFVTTWWRNTTK